MSDTMAGAVGLAMHEDRLERAARNLRAIEAEQEGRGALLLARFGIATRRTKRATVRTVAGIPVAIGGDFSSQGMSGAIRLVRNSATG